MGDLPVQKPALKLRSAFFKVRRDETDNHSFQDFKWVTQQGNRPAALGHLGSFAGFRITMMLDFLRIFGRKRLRRMQLEKKAASHFKSEGPRFLINYG